jgi:hypothetical protein
MLLLLHLLMCWFKSWFNVRVLQPLLRRLFADSICLQRLHLLSASCATTQLQSRAVLLLLLLLLLQATYIVIFYVSA